MAEKLRDTGQGITGIARIVPRPHVCVFCGRAFSKESTISKHLCEQGRRFKQKSEKHVMIGFQAYIKFYEISQPGPKQKTYEEFAKSPYYLALVRFGQYTLDVKCFNALAYATWLITNSCPIDKWNSDKIYTAFLQEWITVEDHYDAASRTLGAMADWADEKESVFNHYFHYATSSRIINDISNGRISPWVIYNSKSGPEWLETLTPEELSIIWTWINSDKWKNIFLKHPDRQVAIVDLLQKAGV